MKVIFLDIDGVLNNELFTIMLHDRLLGKEQYYQCFKDLGEMPFDYRSCYILQALIRDTGAKVVLSSTWRLSQKHIDGIKRYAGIEIHDKTPRIIDKSGCRGDEIQLYLHEHPEIENYVIIDDDSDMLPMQMSHFVKCDGKCGFGDAEYVRCRKILEMEV